ncbi:unnamed protein product [Urochloa decumbens]|uniref:Dof zinc finger protein n=1 Tax=Urochloa decumbens TaxID=240449 RepID=A0ABC8VI81_9POAL
MEAPLHQLPVPLPPLPPPPQEQDTASATAALLRQAAAARAIMMTAAAAGASHQNHQQQPAAMGREQCPRCASRDTKFCYYNNYNTAQPRHFCRACRRYWTLGGSLRNVPVGGSTRKRPRPARPTRAIAAAVAASTASGGSPFAASTCAAAAPPPSSSPAAGLLGSLLMMGGCGSASTLLALGAAAPLLEGRLGSGGLGQPALLPGGGGAGDVAAQLGFFGGAGPIPWPAAAPAMVLEGDRAEDTAWKPAGGAFPLLPAAALWHELAAAAAPAVEAGAGGLLHHGASPHLLM